METTSNKDYLDLELVPVVIASPAVAGKAIMRVLIIFFKTTVKVNIIIL